MKSYFAKGMYDGIPIALGYISVSFGFGIMAVHSGLSVLAASIISATNLTSAGQLLPSAVSSAMGIVLYGMFIAIIIPPARKQLSVLIVVLSAAGLSILFRYVITSVSDGFAIIISAIAASVIGALLFPIKEEEEAAG